MPRVHVPTLLLAVNRDKLLLELFCSEETDVCIPALLSQTTFYAMEFFVMRQCYSQFSDLLIRITAQSNFSRALTDFRQIHMLVIDRLPSEISIYHKGNHYIQASMLYFTFLIQKSQR